jgi:C-terminal processing protease CtpA/Prc
MQGSGIEPDVEVVLTAEDLLLDRDSQLTEAYDYLNDLLSRTVPFR